MGTKNTMVSPEANLVLENLKKEERCIVCKKKYNTNRKCWKPFKMGKGKKAPTSMRISSQIYIGKLTSYHSPYLLCGKCSNRILRFIGVIPDKHDSKVFPQLHSTSVDSEEFFKQLRGEKKTRWQLSYKKAFDDVPNKKGLYKRLLAQACREYCSKYQTPYTPRQLMRAIRSHKNFPLEW